MSTIFPTARNRRSFDKSDIVVLPGENNRRISCAKQKANTDSKESDRKQNEKQNKEQSKAHSWENSLCANNLWWVQRIGIGGHEWHTTVYSLSLRGGCNGKMQRVFKHHTAETGSSVKHILTLGQKQPLAGGTQQCANANVQTPTTVSLLRRFDFVPSVAKLLISWFLKTFAVQQFMRGRARKMTLIAVIVANIY